MYRLLINGKLYGPTHKSLISAAAYRERMSKHIKGLLIRRVKE